MVEKQPLSPLRQKKYAELRKELIRRRELLRKVLEGDANALKVITEDGTDEAVSVGLMEIASKELRQIDLALERIREHTYGRCVECSRLIAVPRLEALPTAERCIECQSDFDKKEAPTSEDTFESVLRKITDERQS